jgi:hypothetical protein
MRPIITPIRDYLRGFEHISSCGVRESETSLLIGRMSTNGHINRLRFESRTGSNIFLFSLTYMDF